MSLLLLFSAGVVGGVGSVVQADAGDTVASATTLALAAAASISEAGDTLSGVAVLPLAAVLSVTEADDVLTAAGALVTVMGAASMVEQGDTVTATGYSRAQRHSLRYWRALSYKHVAIPPIRDMN